MRILVDELPYDKNECIFYDKCDDANSRWCPITNETIRQYGNCCNYVQMCSHQDYMNKLVKKVREVVEDFYE